MTATSQMVPPHPEDVESVRKQRTAAHDRAPTVAVSVIVAALPVLAVWVVSYPAVSAVILAGLLVARALFGAVRRR